MDSSNWLSRNSLVKTLLLTVLSLEVYTVSLSLSGKYYTNMPMQYAAIFKGCKNDNF